MRENHHSRAVRHLMLVAGVCFSAILLTSVLAEAARKPAPKKPVSTITGFVSSKVKNATFNVSGTGSGRVNRKSALFIVKGKSLSGTHRVLFIADGKKYAMTVKVPKGGKLVLKSVRFKSASSRVGTARAHEEDVDVRGKLTSVDCTGSTITVTTDAGDVITLSFDLSVTTVVDESTGKVITACSDLSALAGDPVEVEARVNPDNSLFALAVEVNPTQDDTGKVEFNGTVSDNSGCPNSITVMRDDGVSVVVNLSSSTEINIEGAEDDSSGTCSDLSTGTEVKVEGAQQPDGSVNADEIDAQLNAFDSSGTITDTSGCAASPQTIQFTPDGSSSAITVTIGIATRIEVNDNDEASCTDLTAGAAAQVEGVQQSDGSVSATSIDQSTDSEDDRAGH